MSGNMLFLKAQPSLRPDPWQPLAKY